MAEIVYTNSGAIRNKKLIPLLERRLQEAVSSVYGEGYTAQVYSGGQPARGEKGRRTGSVRHNHGRAADVYIVAPDGKRVTGDGLAPLGQYWAAKKYGGVGLEMHGGGIHLDAWSKPPPGGGMSWNYARKGGRFTKGQRQAVSAGLSGELPEMAFAPEAKSKGLGMMALVDRGDDAVLRTPLKPVRKRVTDPALLGQLNGTAPAKARKKVTDPELLKQLNGEGPAAERFAPGMEPTDTTLADLKQDNRGVFTRIDDVVRGVADMATFGTSDEIAASLNSGSLFGANEGLWGDYDKELAAERERDSSGGWERFGGQMVGALAMPAMGARSLGGAALQGAGTGAAYGFGSGEGNALNRGENAVVGGLVGGALGAGVRAGANALGNRAARNSIPSTDDLRSLKDAAYKQSEAAGDIVPADRISELRKRVIEDLTDHGFDPANEPGAMAIVRRLDDMMEKPATLKGLDTLRKVANNGYIPGNKSNNAVLRQVINRIDEFTDDLTGTEALKAGRDYARRVNRVEDVERAVSKAELRAASTGTGGNADNAIRQNVRRLVENPRGMTQTEKKAAERVVRGGGVGQKTMRLAGKLAPTGVVSGVLSGGAGYGLAGPVGLALPLVGAGAKAVADRMTTKNVERLTEIIRSGGRTAKDLAKLARQEKIPLAAVKEIERAERIYQNRLAKVGAMLATDRQRGQPLEITVTKPNNVQ